jgi:predicted TPR repeat methyltransferase
MHACGILPAGRDVKMEFAGLSSKTESPLASAADDLRDAVTLHRAGQLDRAIPLYRRVLSVVPDHPDALHMLGVIEAQKGNPQGAVDLIRRALTIAPDNALAHNNSGNALQDLGRFAEALASYESAIVIKPDYVLALISRGNALRSLGRYGEAVESYDRALAVQAGDADIFYNRGNALREMQHYQAALDSYDRALSLRPHYVEAMHNRSITLRDLNRLDEALESYERALASNPNDAGLLIGYANTLSDLKRPEQAAAAYRAALAAGGDEKLIRYYLAALGAEPPPPNPPREYVEGLFDRYATRFDAALRDLDYRIPEQLFEIVAKTPGGTARDIADLGCGTGQCGVHLRSLARTLTGVDVSQNMLDFAAGHRVYDRLVRDDLVSFLDGHAKTLDLVVAADVFIYVGALEAVFPAVRRALRHGGHFAFSVESDEGNGFSLRDSRRYAHSIDYLRRLAAGNGFVERSLTPVPIRLADGKGIPGYIVVLTAEGE